MHGSGILKFFLIISAISLLFDWYVFSGLKTLSADWSSRLWRNIALWGYLLVSVSVTVLLITGMPVFRTTNGMRPVHEWILSLFLTFLITKLIFIIV
jgi:hypothetical protein